MFTRFLNLKKHNSFKQIMVKCKFTNKTIEINDLPTIPVKRILKSHCVTCEEGFTNLVAPCPFCTKERKITGDELIYVNKITGYFICSCYKYSAEWKVLEKVYNAKKTIKAQKEIEMFKESIAIKEFDEKIRWNNLLSQTTPFENINDNEYSKILETLDLPNIQKSNFYHLSTRIDNLKRNLHFPLIGVGEKIFGYKTLNIRTKTESNTCNSKYAGIILSKYNGKVVNNKKTAVIVPTIIDLLFLIHAKVPYNIVCLPNALASLPQSVLPCLEPFSKLILWFGNEIESWDVARHFSKKLNEKRCFFIRPTNKQLLPHLVPNSIDIETIITQAQPIWHKSITTFASLRQDVICDLENIDKVQGVKWKRFPSLSKILKGHRKGELTILTGPTGSGKTTFMSEYSLDLAMQGVTTLWGSFEIRNSRLARTMLQQMAGIPLETNLDKFNELADEFEKFPIYYMTFHGQQPIKIVMDAVTHALYVYDISHVIIDNLQFMMGTSEDTKIYDRFVRQDLIIDSFRTFATQKNCHVTLVIHPRKEKESDDLTTSSIFGGAKASQEADNILIIQDKRLVSLRGKKYLQVVKNRYSGDLGVMPLDFNKDSLSYAQKKKQSNQQQNDKNIEIKSNVDINNLENKVAAR